jgi:hypothetical protein
MSDDSGKWKAMNKDGSVHDCRTKQDTPTYTLDQVQKKLESMGLILNIQRLMA